MDDETEYHFDATTLVGDVRDKILAELTVAHDKPWNLRPEAEQRAVVERVHDLARGVVRTAVTLISDAGFPSLQGTLEAVAVKSGFKAVVKVPKGADHWEDLIRSEGRDVVLVIADPTEFFKTRGAVPITPDQPPLPYAQEAARVADAAETPPEGWTPEPMPENPSPPENASGVTDEAPAAKPEEDEGVVMEEAAFRSAMEGYAIFHVNFVADGQAIWYCWRDGDGKIRGHEDEDAARMIAARQKEAWDATAWDGPEEREAKGRKKRLNGGGAHSEASA